MGAAGPVETPEEIGLPSPTDELLELMDGSLAISIESNKGYLEAGP
jgi:hypothetical protein